MMCVAMITVMIVSMVIQVFWWRLARHIPLWVAPNAITFLGLLLNITMTTIVILYDHNLKGEVMCWIVQSYDVIVLDHMMPLLLIISTRMDIPVMCSQFVHVPNP